MNNWIRKTMAVCIAGISAILLCACGSEPAEEKKKEEITFWTIGVEEPDASIWGYAVDKFNQYQDNDYIVRHIPTQNDIYKEKLVIAASSGECPDAYVTWSGGPMAEYIHAGFAQPLDVYVEEYGLRNILMDLALEQGSYEGKVYGLPVLNISVSGIYYNKEIFGKYNLEVPETISELEAVCDTLVSAGITPFALANASKWPGVMYYSNFVTRYGGIEPVQKAVAGEGTFEDESFLYAGRKIQEWVRKGYFPGDTNALSEDDGIGRELLYQEKAAMTCIGSWYTGTMKGDNEEMSGKMDWFPFPRADGRETDPSLLVGTIGDNFISFSCTGDKLDAAVSMAVSYFDEECLELMIQNGKIPPVKDAADRVADPVSRKILNAVTGASAVQLWYDHYLPPEVAEVFNDTCYNLFGLKTSPEIADQRLQEAMDAYLLGDGQPDHKYE